MNRRDGSARSFVPDGTPEGFLSALHCALRAGTDAVIEDGTAGVQGSLFDRVVRVAGDGAVAAGLLDRTRRVVSEAAARRVYYAALSEAAGAGAIALAYLRLGFELGAAVDDFQADSRVRRMHALASRVGGEIHRLKGLLRFRRLEDGSWWAPAEPVHRVLLPVAHHFRRRMPGERWALHDLRRNLAVVWDGRELREADAAALWDSGAPRLNPEERSIEDSWRVFFRRIAVPGRENPGLQARNMPRRYWKHLVELCESHRES